MGGELEHEFILLLNAADQTVRPLSARKQNNNKKCCTRYSARKEKTRHLLAPTNTQENQTEGLEAAVQALALPVTCLF